MYKMNKTITVEVLRRVKHPIYGKFVKKSSKLTAHDEKNQCDIGDLVRIKNYDKMDKSVRVAVVLKKITRTNQYANEDREYVTVATPENS